MKTSVIICTYNRSASLQRTLESLDQMKSLASIEWEVIVVDNNSKDDTRAVIEDFAGKAKMPCRYVLELKQGQSHARNRGIEEARGDIIAFIDDDVLVDPYWLKNLTLEFRAEEMACMGGKILPVWEKPRPEWLRGELFNFLALQDLGDKKLALNAPVIWGANLAIHSSMFRKHGVFNPMLGHNQGKLYGGEETEFVMRLLEHGESVFYTPNVLVYHCIPKSRMEKSYFRKWVFDKGELKAIQLGDYHFRNIMGIPLYIFREAASEFFRYLWKQTTSPTSAFHNQLVFVSKIGMLAGRWKYRKGNSG